jgi:Glycosyltransferase family 9 (heptosyltransferase)
MKDQAPITVDSPAGRFAIESMGGDFDNGPGSFMDCAAVMENCDLIVTSDMAIAHLAGALGRPVFVALKSVPDWGWLLDREDSLWYPSVRLFRQGAKNDWGAVFKKIAAATEVRILEKAREPKCAVPASPAVSIPSSVGELIDKITILGIKESRVTDIEKLAHIRHELSLLQSLRGEYNLPGDELVNFPANSNWSITCFGKQRPKSGRMKRGATLAKASSRWRGEFMRPTTKGPL